VGRVAEASGRAKRVLFDGRYIQDRYHGIGRYAYHIVEELAALFPDITFLLLTDPGAPDSRFRHTDLCDVPNVQTLRARAPVFSLKEQLALPLALLKEAPALYHTPYFALPWVLPRRMARIVTVHDCIFERDRRYMPRRWARIYYQLLMRASMRRSRVVVVPSKATAADVRRFYRIPPRKLVITPEAADPAFCPASDGENLERLRHQYGLPEKFVLAVGMRRPHKNFATLVRAVCRLDSATLVFIGDADERFADETKLAAQGAGESKVRFLGKVPERDLPGLYNLASALACPSLVEGFGLPLVEAMASGTPVICSDIPVFREVAASAALFVPATDEVAWAAAVERVLSSPSLQTQLRSLGLERAGHFSWRSAALALLPTYERFLKPS
jgi:glycosyltransferase involved in cell wall biosynthesis